MLAEANNERQSLREQLRKVDSLIEAIKAMDPHADSPTPSASATEFILNYPTSSVLRPRDAILRAMELAPGQLLAPKDVVARVRELGLYNSELASGPTAYSTALARLADEDGSHVQRTPDGQYFYEDHMSSSIRRGVARTAAIIARASAMSVTPSSGEAN